MRSDPILRLYNCETGEQSLRTEVASAPSHTLKKPKQLAHALRNGKHRARTFTEISHAGYHEIPLGFLWTNKFPASNHRAYNGPGVRKQ